MTETKDKNKYWIEPGKFVERTVGLNIPLTVEEVLKGKDQDRTITIGVKCHWIDSNGAYQQGTFRTDELRPHVNMQQNVKTTDPR